MPCQNWTIPISLGDSHHGYRVMGTNTDYFEYFRFAGGRRVKMAEGRIFNEVFDAVLGADVAKALGCQLDEEII